MEVFIQVQLWFVRSMVLVMLFLTVLPLVHTGWWVIRVCDFPRLQIFVLAAVAIPTLFVWAMMSGWDREPLFWAALCGLIAAWQASYIVRFTPLWTRSIESASKTDFILVVANLDFRNDEKPDAVEALLDLNADLYLLIEVDNSWSEALEPVRGKRPYRLESVQDEGLGIVLWSRLPMTENSIEHFVSEQRPALCAQIEVNGKSLKFIGIHPTPPGLEVRGDEGRHDSRIRDAELLLVADRVAEQQQVRWIVAGDFNDVAWSRTTTLFARRSGLNDPRVGRGLLNTYHAVYPPLRYPLDHVFVSPGFQVGAFERVRLPGSDHFAVRVELKLSETGGMGPEPERPPTGSGADSSAGDLVGEGRSDAAELGREAD
jgi:endonuclease/exonuclease/phosphatase (EEP) superfamily protein YafD